ncbi:hypothetical protein [Maricaulis sp.]|uniref:hypothetical protein n=1 Tax=Maricaulis sp. TaxID=1486257 RepID=UPI002639492D|nr:hypothetical protein [Maricaulis sp.]
MRIILISACTLAFYAGPVLAQDANQTQPVDQQIQSRGVDYARDDSDRERARTYARETQRMMRERQQNEESQTQNAPLPIGETVIVDNASGPDREN